MVCGVQDYLLMDPRVRKVDGPAMLREMRQNIEIMLAKKRHAIQVRITKVCYAVPLSVCMTPTTTWIVSGRGFDQYRTKTLTSTALETKQSGFIVTASRPLSVIGYRLTQLLCVLSTERGANRQTADKIRNRLLSCQTDRWTTRLHEIMTYHWDMAT